MKKLVGISTATRKQHGMVEYRGETWRSVGSMAKAYGIGMPTLVYHMESGDTVQAVMDYLLAKGTAIEPSAELREKYLAFLFRGVYYTSPTACAEAFGLKSGSLSYLRRRGYSAEQAMERLLAA